VRADAHIPCEIFFMTAIIHIFYWFGVKVISSGILGTFLPDRAPKIV
jgi:hypothetical protein